MPTIQRGAAYIDCSGCASTSPTVDYIRHAAKLIIEDEAQSNAVTNQFSTHYDASLAFRVFETLRNFTQHSGFPVHEVHFKSKVVREKRDLPLRNTIIPILNIEKLRGNDKFKKAVLREIEQHGGKVNLKVFAREYVSCIAKVHDVFRAGAEKNLIEGRQIFDELTNSLFDGCDDKEPRFGHFAVAFEKDVRVAKIPLFTGLSDYGDYLSKSNMHFIHAEFKFVSSEDDD